MSLRHKHDELSLVSIDVDGARQEALTYDELAQVWIDVDGAGQEALTLDELAQVWIDVDGAGQEALHICDCEHGRVMTQEDLQLASITVDLQQWLHIT